jgi:hypothetical protein
MSIAYPTCSTCAFHTRLPGARFLLCTLPPECGPVPATVEEMDVFIDDRRAIDERGGTYLGTDCDRMRRMGATCGPRGAMWTPIEGDQA